MLFKLRPDFVIWKSPLTLILSRYIQQIWQCGGIVTFPGWGGVGVLLRFRGGVGWGYSSGQASLV